MRQRRRPTARKNPIPPRDKSYQLDPLPLVAGTILEDDCADESEAGIFHVTTQGKMVFDDGRLRSRVDVGKTGLGGGLSDKGEYISFVLSFPRAMWLWKAIVSLASECRSGTAAGVVEAVLSWTDFPYLFASGEDLVFDDDGELTEDAREGLEVIARLIGLNTKTVNVELLADDVEWRRVIERYADRINSHNSTAVDRYMLARALETKITDYFVDPVVQRSRYTAEIGACFPIVGFTARPSTFLEEVDPKNVTIVQVAAKKGAKAVDLVPDECEIKLRPQDIQVVAIGCEGGGRLHVVR